MWLDFSNTWNHAAIRARTWAGLVLNVPNKCPADMSAPFSNHHSSWSALLIQQVMNESFIERVIGEYMIYIYIYIYSPLVHSFSPWVLLSKCPGLNVCWYEHPISQPVLPHVTTVAEARAQRFPPPNITYGVRVYKEYIKFPLLHYFSLRVLSINTSYVSH